MELTEVLSFVFLDSLMADLVLPFQEEIAMTAIKIFGGYPIYLIMAIGVVSGVIASIVNIALGKFIALAFRIRSTSNELDSKEKKGVMCTTRDYVQSWGGYLLLLAGLPIFGSILTVVLGVFSVPFKKVIYFTSISYFIYGACFFLL